MGELPNSHGRTSTGKSYVLHGIRTPLHLAAVNGNRDVAELLLASKADVNAKTNRGLTPLGLALDKDHQEVAELLRRHGGEE